MGELQLLWKTLFSLENGEYEGTEGHRVNPEEEGLVGFGPRPTRLYVAPQMLV